jgi:hypothetical protein
MAEKGLNCGINKTSIMATKITVPDIGDFESVEIIEILAKPGSIIKKNEGSENKHYNLFWTDEDRNNIVKDEDGSYLK